MRALPPPPISACRTPWLPAVAACGLLLPLAPAQSVSGSETATQLARGALSGGGTTASASGTVDSALSATSSGPVASSESFQLVPGVVWTEPVLGTDEPILYAIEPATGAATGAQVRTLRGLNFTAPGAGATDVTFGSLPATDVQIVGPTEIQVTTPAGIDAVGNPLAGVPVQVQNALGSGAAADEFRYLPAVYLYSPAQLGDPLALRMSTEPNALAFLWFGLAIDGFPPLPIPGFAGAYALLNSQTFLANGTFLPSGELTLPIPIPGNPNLVGVELSFQGAAVTDFVSVGGSFTNVLPVPVQL